VCILSEELSWSLIGQTVVVGTIGQDRQLRTDNEKTLKVGLQWSSGTARMFGGKSADFEVTVEG
jgi:hypothetical protein